MQLAGGSHRGGDVSTAPTCPFCPYQPRGSPGTDAAIYDLAHHVELTHRESGSGRSPFEVHDDDGDQGRPRSDPRSRQRLTVDDGSRSKRASGSLSPSPTPATSSRRSGSESAHYDSERDNGDVDVDGAEHYVDCPENCGETISRRMIDQHMSLHRAEEMALDELEGQYSAVGARPEPPDQYSQHDSSSHSSRDRDRDRATTAHEAKDDAEREDRRHGRGILKDLFGTTSARQILMPSRSSKSNPSQNGQRLGRKELGPHAYEEKMPSWLLKQLQDGPPVTWINQIGPDGRTHRVERVANETSGLVPALASLCRQDRSVSKAWLCSPGARHIFKMRREGGFCGYRNIQMQVSWMQYHRHPGHEHFSRRGARTDGLSTPTTSSATPNILDLQTLIEDAWRAGFNSSGRAETGGIVGTRKYIGTPEAQALFQFLGIGCRARPFTPTTRPPPEGRNGGGGEPVYALLLEYVLSYFSRGFAGDPGDKVYVTGLPPIYFQHPGHSLTIVGIEVHRDREVDLLVFDPMFATVPAMIRYLGTGSAASGTANPGKILKAFRRGEDYLKKYKSFEVLHLERDGEGAQTAAALPA